MSLLSDSYLRELFLNNTPLIDVRAPIEFSEGKIPNSVNHPILNNEERHLIGTCFKMQGQDAAIALGHKLVSGTIKEERVMAWADYIRSHPTAQIFCFRGGLRSQIACSWLSEIGIERAPISGGQKRLRQFFLSILNEASFPKIIRLGGLTGSGKTKVLKQIPHHIDLEELAQHRGSAFGYRGPQPAQATFENLIAAKILKNPEKIIVEDESATIGNLGIPRRFRQAMIESSLVILHADINERIHNIFDDYVIHRDCDFFITAVKKISKQLGDLRTAALIQEIREAFASGKDISRHASWIQTLLVEYYDRYYLKAIERQKERIVFEGTQTEILQYFVKGI